MFFSNFNQDLTEYISKWVFAKINLEKLGLNWLNLVKLSAVLTENLPSKNFEISLMSLVIFNRVITEYRTTLNFIKWGLVTI